MDASETLQNPYWRKTICLSLLLKSFLRQKQHDQTCCCAHELLDLYSSEKHAVAGGRNQYECTVCQRKFAWKSSLTAHLRCHTGLKPYSCKICGKAFADSSNLRKHMVTHAKIDLNQ